MISRDRGRAGSVHESSTHRFLVCRARSTRTSTLTTRTRRLGGHRDRTASLAAGCSTNRDRHSVNATPPTVTLPRSESQGRRNRRVPCSLLTARSGAGLCRATCVSWRSLLERACSASRPSWLASSGLDRLRLATTDPARRHGRGGRLACPWAVHDGDDALTSTLAALASLRAARRCSMCFPRLTPRRQRISNDRARARALPRDAAAPARGCTSRADGGVAPGRRARARASTVRARPARTNLVLTNEPAERLGAVRESWRPSLLPRLRSRGASGPSPPASSR